MTAPTNPRAREREALEEAQCAIDDVYLHTYTASEIERAAIRSQLAVAQEELEAYGRAVREADKEAIQSIQDWLNACDSPGPREYGAQDALTRVRKAIEVLEQEEKP